MNLGLTNLCPPHPETQEHKLPDLKPSPGVRNLRFPGAKPAGLTLISLYFMLLFLSSQLEPVLLLCAPPSRLPPALDAFSFCLKVPLEITRSNCKKTLIVVNTNYGGFSSYKKSL